MGRRLRRRWWGVFGTEPSNGHAPNGRCEGQKGSAMRGRSRQLTKRREDGGRSMLNRRHRRPLDAVAMATPWGPCL